MIVTGEYRIERVERTEPYEPARRTVVDLQPGHMAEPEQQVTPDGGAGERVELTTTFTFPRLLDVQAGMEVIDGEGRAWTVESVTQRAVLGAARTTCRVRRVVGASITEGRW